MNPLHKNRRSPSIINPSDCSCQIPSSNPLSTPPPLSSLTMSSTTRIEAALTILAPSEDPHNWSPARKWVITIFCSVLSFATSMGSSIVTPSVPAMEIYFNVSRVTAILSLSLYILGISFGPLLFSPLSEVYGRKTVVLPTWALFVIFQVPAALATHINLHLVSRLIQGIAGSPALTVLGGTLGDMWVQEELGLPVGLFALSAFLGPVAGPISGGYLAQFAPGGKLESWRWTQWVMAMFGGVLLLVLAWMPETYAPTLAMRKRKTEKKRAKQNAEDPEMEKLERHVTASEMGGQVMESIFHPFELLVKDPIVLLMSLHMSMIYGILYIYFGGYPIVFSGRYGWKQGPSGLAFLGIGVGVLLSIPTSHFGNKLYLRQKHKREDPDLPHPEGRLPFAILASALAPISAFWFAWSGTEGVHWIVPVLSGVPFGWSMVTLFVGLLGYLAETYLEVVASCLASATVMRSLFAFGFPLFTPTMYEDLTPEWAGTLLGCILCLFAPIPFLFYKFGPAIRRRSKFTTKVGLEV